jgi:LEA14-like dessication related protein
VNLLRKFYDFFLTVVSGKLLTSVDNLCGLFSAAASYVRLRKKNTPKLFYVNRNELLALGAVGLVAAVLWSKARAAGTLIFQPGRVQNLYFDGVSPVIQLSLVVQNTSSSGFTLESLAGNILSDGYIIGNFSNFQPIHINANSETVVPISIRLGMIGLVQDLITSFTTGDFTKRVTLQGFVNAGFVRAPINVSFEIGSGLNRKQ